MISDDEKPTQEHKLSILDTTTTTEDDSTLTKSELELEELFNQWGSFTTNEKFKIFLKFSKDFTGKFLPVSIIYLIFIVTSLSNVIFAMKTEDNDKIIGIGFGNIIYNVFAIGLGIGLSTALDSLCSQSFASNNFRMNGLYLNRCYVILTIMAIPLSTVIFFADPILRGIGQDKGVAKQAGLYCWGFIPGILLFFFTDANRRFLQAQGHFIKPVVIVLVTSLLHPVWIILLFKVANWGLFGIGLAQSITNTLNFIASLYFIKKYTLKETNVPLFQMDSVRGLKEFLSVAVPSCMMSCLESWNTEFVTIMIGYLPKLIGNERGKDQIAAHVVILQIYMFTYMFPFGLSFASANLIGKFIGRNSPRAAKVGAKLVIYFLIIIATLLMLFVLAFRPILPKIFIDKASEIEICKKLLLIYMFFGIFDTISLSLGGFFRAIGKQKIIAILNFVAYYVVNLPLVYIFIYQLKMKVYGAWYAYVISGIIIFTSFMIVYFRLNYHQICKTAKKRIEDEKKTISED